jgi:hypothetical protein
VEHRIVSSLPNAAVRSFRTGTGLIKTSIARCWVLGDRETENQDRLALRGFRLGPHKLSAQAAEVPGVVPPVL